MLTNSSSVYPADPTVGPPPGYEVPNVVTAADVERNDPPPTYDSLFGKIRQAKDSSAGNIDFGKKVKNILTESVVFFICLAILVAIPVAEIVVGAIYLDDCPANKNIPVYLIVAGVFQIVAIALQIGHEITKEKDECTDANTGKKKKNTTCCSAFGDLVNGFLFVWFITGNVWVYSLDWDSDPNAPRDRYCHSTVYYFAFWIITSAYIIIGLICLIGISCFICVICKKKE